MYIIFALTFFITKQQLPRETKIQTKWAMKGGWIHYNCHNHAKISKVFRGQESLMSFLVSSLLSIFIWPISMRLWLFQWLMVTMMIVVMTLCLTDVGTCMIMWIYCLMINIRIYVENCYDMRITWYVVVIDT